MHAMSNGKKGRFSTVPMAGGGIARAAYAHALQARISVQPLLKSAGLTTHQIENPRVRIPVKNQITFLDQVAKELHDEFLGIRLAQQIDVRELGLLYYVMSSSETLGDALYRVARYSTIQNEGVHIRYQQGNDAKITLEYFGVARASDRQQIEFIVTFLLRVCRTLAGRRVVPSSVKLFHYRSRLPSEFGELFGPDVTFNSNVDQFTYPRSTSQIRMVSADSYLNSLLLSYCDEAVANRHTQPSAWCSKVENAIAPLLPHGQARIGEISKRLGVSRRTLARRLASEDLTYRAVLDNLRRDLARRYLQERTLPISEIAWLVGYRETSAFDHAFKRWTGKRPRRA
jgi:AraC-like DNA-binding protein